jgi:hypothetical protein
MSLVCEKEIRLVNSALGYSEFSVGLVNMELG